MIGARAGGKMKQDWVLKGLGDHPKGLAFPQDQLGRTLDLHRFAVQKGNPVAEWIDG